jgi:hypothetical protein
MARISKLFSFSNVVACLALFVALGGSVYAAGKISGKQIKRSSLPGNRIKPKTIPANRVKLNSLTGRQIKANSITGKQINQKTLTKVSAVALASVQYQAVTTTLPVGGDPTTLTADCPPGSFAIGGGATLSKLGEATLAESGPSPLRTGWTGSGRAWYSSGVTMTVTAVCAVVDKPGGASTTTGSGASTTTGPQYHPAG